MNTTRIKYLDMDECPSNVLNEKLVVGIICIGLPFGIWWLGCLLFGRLGWEVFYKVFHLAGFIVALFFGLGITYGAKTSAASASYGAFFLDAAVAALFFWIVRGEFWTLWTPVALSGLAIHFAGKIPAVARLRERRNAAADEAGLRQTAEMLVEQGKDPELVRQAMDEAIARAGNPKYSSSSAFRLVQALAEKENA